MTTDLEVINAMLGAIGELSVTGADNLHPSVLAAKPILARTNKEFQRRGWWFNSEENLVLQPESTTGEIILPQNTLRIDPVDRSSQLVHRGRRFYDKMNHTYNIGTSVKVNCVVLLPVEDLPESAALYVMHKSVYDFYVREDGDKDKAIMLQQDMIRAWAEVRNEQTQAKGTNALNSPASVELQYGIRPHSGYYLDPNMPGGRT